MIPHFSDRTFMSTFFTRSPPYPSTELNVIVESNLEATAFSDRPICRGRKSEVTAKEERKKSERRAKALAATYDDRQALLMTRQEHR
ncbi:hypothetical protein JQM83_04360 [Parabacteroides distasonis]|nr:hypothetical protein [Parabacteroides distasonis]